VKVVREVVLQDNGRDNRQRVRTPANGRLFSSFGRIQSAVEPPHSKERHASVVPVKFQFKASVRSERASVLLEVVLALALFIGAATVISAGISASVEAVHRVRLQTHAANLAISLMAELKIGARPLTPVGPENFEAPFKGWLYRVNLTAGESSTETASTRAVEVIVWHTQENIVHRITQLFRASELTRAEGEAQ
jgi:hypothetical protein